MGRLEQDHGFPLSQGTGCMPLQQLHFPAPVAARGPHARAVPAGVTDPLQLIRRLLFVVECPRADLRDQKRRLNLFLTRHGGFHLLLVLLDGHYRDHAEGTRRGLVFSEICSRIEISERGLRMLINDAVAMKLVVQMPLADSDDRRRRSYGLTLPVVRAWETLLGALDGVLPALPARETRAGAIGHVPPAAF